VKNTLSFRGKKKRVGEGEGGFLFHFFFEEPGRGGGGGRRKANPSSEYVDGGGGGEGKGGRMVHFTFYFLVAVAPGEGRSGQLFSS